MKPRRLKSGNYFLQVQVNGVRRSFCAPTRAEVIRKATEYKVTAVDAPSAPLGALIDQYIDAKRNILSPSTVTNYEKIRRNDFQRLMTVPVRELTSERLQVEINIMSATKSPKTVRNAYGLISATLALFAPDLRFHVTLPAKKQITYQVPTIEEVFDLLTHASTNLKTAIMLAAFCGLRRGEIAALTSDDVHDNVIHVHSAAVLSHGQLITRQPKTYTSDRYIPAPEFVIEYISQFKGRVCPISINSITKRFEELREKLGYKCRFHDLRHYYASALHAIGVPDQYVMKLGGWRSDAVLKSVYRGTLDDFEAEAAGKAVGFFEQSANKMLTTP